MQDLAQDRLVIAPDYRGLGQTDRPDRPLDITDHADIMAEVLIAAGWGPDGRGRVDACGYHTGTFFATELALLITSMGIQITLPTLNTFAAKILHPVTPSSYSTLTAWKKSGRALKTHRAWRSVANPS